MSDYKKSLLALLAFLLLLQSAAILIADLNRPPWGDERYFVETIRCFGREISIDTISHYDQMSGPLPFVLYALWGRLVGFELYTLRLLSILIALISYLLFHRILFTMFGKPAIPFWASAFLAMHPYMLGFSIFVFTDGLMILGLLVVWYAVTRRNPWLLFLGTAAALLSRQYAISFVMAMSGFYALQAFMRKTPRSVPMLTASILAVVPLGTLFLLWNGFSPINEKTDLYMLSGLAFHPSALTLYVSLFVVYLWPVVLLRFRSIYRNKQLLLGCFVLSWVYWLIPVEPSPFAVDINVHTVGLFHRLLVRIVAAPWFSQAVFYLAFALGLPLVIVVLWDTCERLRSREPDLLLLLNFMIILFLVVMPFSYLTWEKYLVPLLPFAILRLLLMRRSPPGIPATNQD